MESHALEIGVVLGPRTANGEMGPVEDAVAEIARGEKEVRVFGQIIGDVGATALAAAIEKSVSLQNIWLSDNQITDVGAKALAAAIEISMSFQKFDLSRNPITDVGAIALAAAIEKSRCVSYVKVPTGTGKRAIARALRLRPSRRAVWALCGNVDDDRRAPIVHFLRKDGDHGALTRVLQFLLGGDFKF